MLKNFFQTVYGLYAAAIFVVVVLLVFCPLLIVAPTLRLRREIGRAAVRVWLFLSFIPFRVRGLEHLPSGACIALCNHASYVDGLILTAALPARFTFLVQSRAADWPYIGIVIKRMGVSLVNRWSAREAAAATRGLLDRARAGDSFVIFPEGTFHPSSELMPFHAGAFVIAARAGVPVVPGVVRGTRPLLGDGRKLLRWGRLDVEFFAPIRAADASREAADALHDAARKIMLAHCGEADGQISESLEDASSADHQA